jgi:hypothetical protein
MKPRIERTKNTLAAIILLIVLLLCSTKKMFAQGYDTTSFIRCQITKIERDMRVGNWLTIERDNGEVRYAIKHYVGKQTKELLGECILLGKDIWDKLPKTKR